MSNSSELSIGTERELCLSSHFQSPSFPSQPRSMEGFLFFFYCREGKIVIFLVMRYFPRRTFLLHIFPPISFFQRRKVHVFLSPLSNDLCALKRLFHGFYRTLIKRMVYRISHEGKRTLCGGNLSYVQIPSIEGSFLGFFFFFPPWIVLFSWK